MTLLQLRPLEAPMHTQQHLHRVYRARMLPAVCLDNFGDMSLSAERWSQMRSVSDAHSYVVCICFAVVRGVDAPVCYAKHWFLFIWVCEISHTHLCWSGSFCWNNNKRYTGTKESANLLRSWKNLGKTSCKVSYNILEDLHIQLSRVPFHLHSFTKSGWL